MSNFSKLLSKGDEILSRPVKWDQAPKMKRPKRKNEGRPTDYSKEILIKIKEF